MPSLPKLPGSDRLRDLKGISLRDALVLAILLFLVYIILWYYLMGEAFQSMVFSDVSSILINGLAALCLLYAAALSRNYERKLYRAWLLLFAAQFSFFLGDVFFTYYDLILEQSTSPSLADIFYLLYYPLFLLGILLLPAADFKYSERIKLLLDTGIVLISSILIYWSFFIAPVIEQNRGADPQIVFLALAYPIGDLMQLFALIELLFRRTRKTGADPLLFLGLFCAGNIIADAVYMRESMAGTYVSGGLIDALWIFSYLMIALAGIAQVNYLRSGHYALRLDLRYRYGEIQWPLYLPYLSAGLAFAMLIYSYSHPLPIPFSVLSLCVGLIIALVIARQVLVLRENASLYMEAQQEIAERKAMQAQVVKLNQELEGRVADRTSQIETANKDLQRQMLDRQMAQEALRNSERRLADIINFLPDATFVINREGVVIAWNRALEKMTGIKAAQILGAGGYEHALPFYGERRPVLADNVLNPGLGQAENYENLKWQEDDTISGEFFIPNLLGRPAYLQGSAAVLYDSEGAVYGAIESIRDITERKVAEEDLKNARDRAESATEAKSRFLANMSHEIRTPMNAVIGMSDLLLQMGPTEEQRDYLEVIKNSGNALLVLINDILDYSKIDGSKLELKMLPFHLTGCIEASMDLVAAGAAEKCLDIVYFLDEDVPERIIGDEGRLRQILINLLGNAVKFTEKGEVILTIGSSPGPEGKVKLCFAIRDTGIGISKEDLGRLFQSFSQGTRSTTRYYGGTGLGLAISRRLVEMMHGDISVQSTLGEGSTFSFHILCHLPLQSTDSHPQDKRLEGKKVLIVEGNQWVQKMIQKSLDSWKMEVAIASGGMQAEDRMAGGKFDFVILDALLPDMEGWQLTQKIAAMPDKPLIVMINHIGRRARRDPSLSGTLSKPIKPGQLKLLLVGLMQPQGGYDQPKEGFSSPDPGQKRSDLAILLAEDNPVNQKVALSMLKRLGYKADVAINGRDVLSMLKRKAYDIILMDIQMPDMDGLDTTRRIREMGTQEQPCIIAMTAYALDGDRERFLQAGMNHYLSKPIRIDELKKALELCRVAL